MNNDQLKVAIEALHMSLKQLYHDGVPTDKCHPRRIAADAVEEAIASLTAAQSAQSGKDEREAFDQHWAVCGFVPEGANPDHIYAAMKSGFCAGRASLAKVEQEPVVNSDMMNAGADAMREGMCMLNSGRSYQSVCKKIFEAMLAAAPQAQQEAGTDDATDDQCIELAEALCWESMRQAIAGTRNAASLLEDASFRIGMETACDEIETRLNLASPAQTATVQELDNILQELVDIAQENDMGYGAPAAQADTQQSKKGEGE